MKEKFSYADKFYRSFSLWHMFNKGYLIPDELIKYIKDKNYLKRIREHNERVREKQNE